MLVVSSKSRAVVLAAGLLSGLTLLVAGCPQTPPAADPPPAENTPTTEGSAAPEAAAPTPPADPAAGTAPAPRPDGQPATCDFVPTEVPVGGVACPEGCVMVKGAPLNPTEQCAMTGFQYEVALACLRLPMDVEPTGSCYVNADGHAVLSALHYPALSERGWTPCPEDFPLRAAPPCPAAAPEEAQAPEAE